MVKYILVALALGLLTWLAYDKVYSIGYNTSEKKYTEYIASLEKVRDKREAEIELLSNLLESDSAKDKLVFDKRIDTLLAEFRKSSKPVTIITEGKCAPSSEYLKTWNDMINEANTNMRTTK